MPKENENDTKGDLPADTKQDQVSKPPHARPGGQLIAQPGGSRVVVGSRKALKRK